MAEGYKALILGLILLFTFGGLLPYILSSLNVQTEDYTGYLGNSTSGAIGLIQNGIVFSIPKLADLANSGGALGFIAGIPFNIIDILFPSALTNTIIFSINPFSWFPNVQNFIVTQLQGYQLIPALIGIPIMIITFVLLLYGIVKLFPG